MEECGDAEKCRHVEKCGDEVVIHRRISVLLEFYFIGLTLMLVWFYMSANEVVESTRLSKRFSVIQGYSTSTLEALGSNRGTVLCRT